MCSRHGDSHIGRVRCAVPFCRRSIRASDLRPGDNDWLCAAHWSLVPKERRRIYHLARRRGNERAAAFIWPRLVAVAIKRAAAL